MCLKTSWLARMRVCEVMRDALAPFRGGPALSARIDEKLPDESFSGNHDRARIKIPKAPTRAAAPYVGRASPSPMRAWPRWSTTWATARPGNILRLYRLRADLGLQEHPVLVR